jgi:hypothetical protein
MDVQCNLESGGMGCVTYDGQTSTEPHCGVTVVPSFISFTTLTFILWHRSTWKEMYTCHREFQFPDCPNVRDTICVLGIYNVSCQ